MVTQNQLYTTQISWELKHHNSYLYCTSLRGTEPSIYILYSGSSFYSVLHLLFFLFFYLSIMRTYVSVFLSPQQSPLCSLVCSHANLMKECALLSLINFSLPSLHFEKHLQNFPFHISVYSSQRQDVSSVRKPMAAQGSWPSSSCLSPLRLRGCCSITSPAGVGTSREFVRCII